MEIDDKEAKAAWEEFVTTIQSIEERQEQVVRDFELALTAKLKAKASQSIEQS